MQLSITINEMSSGKVVLARRLSLKKKSLHKILSTCIRARGPTPLLLHEVSTTNHFRLVYPLLFLAWSFEGQIFILQTTFYLVGSKITVLVGDPSSKVSFWFIEVQVLDVFI